MIEYKYCCTACKYRFTIEQSITEEYLTQCPSCGKTTLDKVFEPATPFFHVENVTTVGQQAERNSKKFGNEQCELKQEKYKQYKKNNKKKTPFWRDGSISGLVKSDKPIDKITVAQYTEQLNKLNKE